MSPARSVASWQDKQLVPLLLGRSATGCCFTASQLALSAWATSAELLRSFSEELWSPRLWHTTRFFLPMPGQTSLTLGPRLSTSSLWHQTLSQSTCPSLQTLLV